MDGTCRRAVELGLPSIAFTEHADWIRGAEAVFDAAGYFECLERCRAAYPDLRIMSGVEMGEPHQHPAEARALLAMGFDRVLASVHCIEWGERTADAAHRGFLTPEDAGEMFRVYLAETLALIESEVPFEVLAHLEYPKRYWPEDVRYDEAAFEEEFRTVLRAAARRGLALEVNTTRGGHPVRYLCPGPIVLGWWLEEGGQAVSPGSDAHSPENLGAGLAHALKVVREAGFERKDASSGFWLR
jgi:histidinol-phosphatase (PHP family)